MSTAKKGLFFGLVFQLSTLSCFALSMGTTGSQFLKLGVGSRACAMGEAFVAVADDVNAVYWNPAGLAGVEGRQVGFIHTEWFQSIRYEYLSYCQQMLGGVMGASATFLWVDGIERRGYIDPSGATLEGYVPARDLSVSLSYGKALSERMNLGLTLKGIYRQLDTYSAGGAAVDIGLLYKPGHEPLSLGLCLQNLGFQSPFIAEPDPLPLNLKAGLSNRVNKDFCLAADLNYGFVDNVWALNAGMEWWVHPAFSIRGGYRYNGASTSSLGILSGISCGAGFRYAILDIDYAFVPYGDLGYTHRISMLVRL